jgi:hypothetical protein
MGAMVVEVLPDFLDAHWHPGSIHSQVHGGCHFSALFHLLVFIDGDLGPQPFGARSTCLALTSTPANSCNHPLLSWKLTSAAALPVMRKTPGVSENDSSPRVRSRGQNPLSQRSQ